MSPRLLGHVHLRGRTSTSTAADLIHGAVPADLAYPVLAGRTAARLLSPAVAQR